jgi:diacylglycerol kinase (ATP)
MKMSVTEDNNKALFILNPKAGVPPVNYLISKDLDRRKHELTCKKSLCISDSEILIKEHYDKYDIFIAAGGDGTVHTIASELVGSNKILGVLPIGSGNGFAREFG